MWQFLEFGLRLIFYSNAYLLTFFKSLFNSLAEAFTLWTTENKDVLSAKSFKLKDKSST